jgi:hypothetical protein
VLNPWTALPESPPYVLPEDRPYVEAWNHQVSNERKRLHTEVVPEPFVGRRNAPLVVLQLNPAWRDLPDARPPDLNAAIRGNLGDDVATHVHPGFLDRFTATSGSWWRKRWQAVIEHSGLAFEDLAERVLAVEWYGYYSHDWATLPVTLPSQWFSFDLAKQAVEREAVILITRGWRTWPVAVPTLLTYRRAFATRNAQNAYISPGNLPPGGFDAVVSAVRQSS